MSACVPIHCCIDFSHPQSGLCALFLTQFLAAPVQVLFWPMPKIKLWVFSLSFTFTSLHLGPTFLLAAHRSWQFCAQPLNTCIIIYVKWTIMEMCSELFQSTCIDFSRILFVANAVLHKSMIAIQYDFKVFRVLWIH